MYNATDRISTIIHTHHCSMYLRASIHMAVKLRAVVSASHSGTVLSVK